jgi:heme-degrading monooxygenase HmoA
VPAVRRSLRSPRRLKRRVTGRNVKKSRKMILRSWSGLATTAGADAYVAYFRGTLLPALRRLEGHRGALVLARGDGDDVKVTVLTLWDSMASIRRFAGADVTAAVVEPEAQAVLTRFDARVEHFDVLLDARS